MEGFNSEHPYYIGVPRKRLEGLWGVFLSDFFRRMAIGLVGIFTPIYIWESTGNLRNVALFYLIYGGLATVSIYPGARVIKLIGVDWGNALGTLFRLVYILALIFAKDDVNFFWISAAALGVCQPFDWLSYNYTVSKITKKKKKYGSNLGLASVVAQLGSATGPLLGGFIITFLGFNYLYIIAASLLFMVAIFPFWDKFEKKGMHVSFGDIQKALKDEGIKKHFFTQGIRVFDMISNTILWPLFLLSVVKTAENTGLIQTISIGLAMIMSYVTGKIIDKKNFFMMYLGSFLVFGAWIVRFLSGSRIELGLANTSHSLGNTMLWTPLSALLMARSVKKYTMEFWMIKEIISYFMIAVTGVFYFLIFGFFDDLSNLSILFPVIAGITLLSLTVPSLYKKYINLIKKL